jgi:single-stranded DNA-binding protein
MRTFNHIEIIGRLGEKPQKTNGITKVKVITDRTDGHPDWHQIIFFDEIDAKIFDSMNQGDMVFVEGEVRYNKKEDKKFFTDIIAHKFIYFGRKNGNGVK